MIKRLMLGIVGAFVFYGAVFFMSKYASAVPSVDPITPVTPPTISEGKATGGVKAVAGAVTVQLDFNAHGGDPVKGKVNYKNSAGGNFKGDVDVCYEQADNEAAFAGTIKKGTFSETYFLVEVEDNGEGKNSPEDRIRVRVMNTMPDCTMSGVYPAEVEKGNLKVH